MIYIPYRNTWRNRMVKNPIAIKIHNHANEVILAACDEALLGKTFEEGELQLEVHEAFYDDLRVDEEDLVSQLNNFTIANLVGENTIKCAIDAGLVNEDNIIRIQGIPHVQIYKMT